MKINVIDKLKGIISSLGYYLRLIINKTKRIGQELRYELISVSPLSGPIKNKGCLFIHIPKAAGSSLSLSLYGYQVGHRKYRDIYVANKKQVDKLYSFTVVRHPIDRFISAYKFLNSGGMNEGDINYKMQVLVKYKDINDFVEKADANTLMEKVHFHPQYTFICDANGFPMVDYIGRYEKLDEVASYISKVIDEKFEIPLINKTKISADKVDEFELSEKSKLKLQTLYEKDFSMFGYSIEKI